MAKSYEQNKEYAKKYIQKFDLVQIRVPAGQKAIWQDHAARAGESLNAYIIKAVQNRMDNETEEARAVIRQRLQNVPDDEVADHMRDMLRRYKPE